MVLKKIERKEIEQGYSSFIAWKKNRNLGELANQKYIDNNKNISTTQTLKEFRKI
jgi:hypothetical protein